MHAQAEETNARLAALHLRHEAAMDLERAQHGARDRVSEQARPAVFWDGVWREGLELAARVHRAPGSAVGRAWTDTSGPVGFGTCINFGLN